jgi:hypothetical protein
MEHDMGSIFAVISGFSWGDKQYFPWKKINTNPLSKCRYKKCHKTMHKYLLSEGCTLLKGSLEGVSGISLPNSFILWEEYRTQRR